VADDINLRLTATDDASKVIDPVVKKAQDATAKKYDLEFTADTAHTAADVQKLGTELEQVVEKAREAGQESITIRVHTDDVLATVKSLEALKGEMTQVDGKTVDVKIKTADAAVAAQQIKGVGAALEDIPNRASRISGATSVINELNSAFVGASTAGAQAGDAIYNVGQSLQSMGVISSGAAASIGEIGLAFAAVAVGLSVFDKFIGTADKLSDAFKEIQTDAGLGLESVQAFSSAMDASNTSVSLSFEGLKHLGEGMISVGTLGTVTFSSMREAVDTFNKVLAQSPVAAANLLTQFEAGFPGLKFTTEQLNQMSSQLIGSVQDQAAAKNATKDYNQAVADANTLLQHGVAIRQQDGESYTDYIAKLRQAAFGYNVLDDAATAAQDAQSKQAAAAVIGMDQQQARADAYRDAIKGIGKDLDDLTAKYTSGAIEASDFAKAMADTTAAGFATHDAAAKAEDAIGSFGDTMKKLTPEIIKEGKAFGESGGHITTYTEAGRKALAALEQLAGPVQKELAQSLVDNAGNYQAVRDKAQSLRDEISKKLIAAGVDKSEVDNYLEFLRLNPGQVEVDVKLAQKQDLATFAAGLAANLQTLFATDPNLAIQYQADLKTDPAKAVADLLAAAGGPSNPIVMHAVAALPAEEGDAVMAELNTQLAASGKTAEIPLSTNPTDANAAMGVWRLDQEGKPVFIPTDCIVDPATGTVNAWRQDENGTWVVVPVDANTAPAADTLDAWMSQHRSVVVDVSLLTPGGMVGIPRVPDSGGSYLVGEAGPERVVLPGRARLMTAGETMMADVGGGGGGPIFNITLNVAPLTNPAEVGGAVVSAIKAYERRSGKGWRAA
jgi:hypothetical protein